MNRRYLPRSLFGAGVLSLCLAVQAFGAPTSPKASPAPLKKGVPAGPAPVVNLDPRTPGDSKDGREQRIHKLREHIVSVLRGPTLSRLRVGIEVMDAATGEVLLSHNAGSAFNPASNTKILTTAAALKMLGASWRYRTVLYAGPDKPPKTASLAKGFPGPEPGVLRSDLFLQGTGDPTLNPQALAELARGLSRAGIVRIEGDLLVDGRFRSLTQIAEEGSAEERGPGALIVNRNSYTVRVHPSSAGQGASVSLEPKTSYLQLDSKVQTTKGKRSRLVITHSRTREGRLLVSVRGRIGERRGAVTERRRIPDGSAFAAVALAQALADFGIKLEGQVKVGPPPGPLTVLSEHAAPLSEVCKLSNKDSNNFVADVIFRTLGGERFGLPGTLQKGQKAVSEWLAQQGVDPSRMKIVNGSGLTHENRLRPDDLSHLLRRLYHDLEMAPEFLQSLAIGGVDGTIRYRFRGPSVGLVRAKTGTLSGVSALSGYVGDRQGVLIFAILVEGFRDKRLDEVRHAQVLMVDAMTRFLRDGKPSAGLPAVPTQEEDPSVEGRDSESDGDPPL